MNRKSVTTIVLVVSLVVNVILFVFSYIQKAAAESARLEASNVMQQLLSNQRQAKAELDQCEGLREQSDEAREICEEKILAVSNRK